MLLYPIGMTWKPIEDLPKNWQDLTSKELPALVTVWSEQADKLRNTGAFKNYLQRLQREIAIETGVIERLYDIDRGITEVLIEQGIDEALIPHGATDLPTKQVVSIIKDQESAIDSLFAFVKGERSLSTSYIKELHDLLTRNQETTDAVEQVTGNIVQIPLRRGEWKQRSNNPSRDDGSTHEYAPPEHVAMEMDNLIQWHLEHMSNHVSPEVEAAWLHHRFTQIHPFQDGNGRVARCLAILVFLKADWFPLVITRDERKEYINSLERADKGDLQPLTALFAKRQVQAFLKSLSLSERILSENRNPNALIGSVVSKLKSTKAAHEEKIAKSEEYSDMLFNQAEKYLHRVVDNVDSSFAEIETEIDVFVITSPSDDSHAHYYRYQVIETAKQLDYYANLRDYHRWIQLVLNVERPTMLLLSFHVFGHEHNGLLVCSACAYHKDEDEDNTKRINEIQALSKTPFQFSYADEKQELTKRFQSWLEDVTIVGLEYWNESI